ncbi:hypothetical protein AAFF_G00288890 [Aldrovandia affinis]|uniref:Uncharacterized protein n=1 Tax=Aldrovandia affinis TaxID=143900 RepID=A0AAD7SRD4_9TELE|nr:hypothetical protein AAFF_G00288890 [Aldrovandia affinis]
MAPLLAWLGHPAFPAHPAIILSSEEKGEVRIVGGGEEGALSLGLSKLLKVVVPEQALALIGYLSLAPSDVLDGELSA